MSNTGPPKNFRVSIKNPSSDSTNSRNIGDEGNPISSLHFEPAWDSDELYDALRVAYPRIGSHKDRFLRAVIEFYDAELGRVRNSGGGLDTPPSSPPSAPENQTISRVFERGSSSEGAEASGGQYASYKGSVFDQHKHSKPRGVGMEGMQATFSILSGGTKLRTKRPMTEEERKQYRHTKRVGACDPCRRRKRKCVCKLAEDQLLEAKKPRISNTRCQVVGPSSSSAEVSEAEMGDNENTSVLVSRSPGLISENAESDMAVSKLMPSASLSPLSLALDSKFDLPGFLTCPELNLGDLAMPDMPFPTAGLHDKSIYFEFPSESPATPRDTSPTRSATRARSPSDNFSQCEPWANTLDLDKPSTSPWEKSIISHRNTMPLDCHPDTDLAASLTLIIRATTALAPFSRFTPDAQHLLGDLRNLTLQLKLFKKSLPFRSETFAYYTAIKEAVLEICDPLQEFLAELERMGGFEDWDGQRHGHAYTSSISFQLRKSEWARSARRLRGMIAGSSSTIASLVTCASMETLAELHARCYPMQISRLDMGVVGEFGHVE